MENFTLPTSSKSDSLSLCTIQYRSLDRFLSFLLLANWSTNVLVSCVNNDIELLWRFVYHCGVGLIRLESNPINMQTSRRSLSIAIVNIICCIELYDRPDPSSHVREAKYFRHSTKTILSTKEFIVGVGMSRICWTMASIAVSIRVNSGSYLLVG